LSFFPIFTIYAKRLNIQPNFQIKITIEQKICITIVQKITIKNAKIFIDPLQKKLAYKKTFAELLNVSKPLKHFPFEEGDM